MAQGLEKFLFIVSLLMIFSVNSFAEDLESIPSPSPIPSLTPSPQPKVDKKSKGKKARREKEAEGTEAADRFEADIVIKSQYKLDGKSLEVDPD